jgi:hypothetical protein
LTAADDDPLIPFPLNHQTACHSLCIHSGNALFAGYAVRA